MPDNGGSTNGAVAKAEVHGLKERFEDCQKFCGGRLDTLEDDMEKVKAFQNRAVGILLVVQFVGFGGLAALIVLLIKAAR